MNFWNRKAVDMVGNAWWGKNGSRHLWMAMAVLVLAAGCATINLGPQIGPLEEKVISGKGPKVLLIDIHGLIINKEKRSLTGMPIKLGLVERVREILQKAEEDEDIEALLVRVNSPGGTVTSSDIIYHDLKSFKTRRNVKIYVSIMDLAASGGYYIAVAGDRIIAHPTSLTGSIGVIAFKVNLQELMDKVGVDFEVVKSGEKKDFMSPLRPFTQEERRLFQEAIDNYHQRFVKIIADNRPQLDVEKVRALADGRVFNSHQALEAHLIDDIGYLDDTVELIKKDLGVSQVEVVTYHRPGEYKTNIYSSLPTSPTINMINLDLGLLSEMSSPQFMYLWMP